MFAVNPTPKHVGHQKVWSKLFFVLAIATICSFPATICANDDSAEEASSAKELKFTVYCWNCSRSLNEAGRFETLAEACSFAAQQKTRTRNVRVIQGYLEHPYDILGYRDTVNPVEYLICKVGDSEEWQVVGRLEKAEHANVLAESFKVEESEKPNALVVHRYK